jgi:spore coat protein CotH
VSGDAPAGYSYGLLPDGTGEPQRLAPTLGAANEIFEVFQADKVVEVRLEMSNASLKALRNNPMADEYQQGNIVYHGVRLDDVAIRTKGTSSLMTAAMDPESNRYSFKVDFNYYVSGQDLAGIQKMNFNNGFSDPTFMREILSYNLMRALDVPAPRCTFVNLYINDELIGLYTAVEQVDDEFVEDNFEQGDGDLYNAEPWSDLLWNGGSINDYPTLALKTNEDTSNHSALITMLDELNNGSDYESVMDVNEVLRYFAVNTVLVSLDSYQGMFGHNYYLYEENGIFRIIPWDYNMSFGAFNIGCDRTHIIEFMIDEPTCGNLEDRPLIAKLLEDPAYLAIYHNYLNELITGPFAPATMDQVIDDTADLIREFVYADPTKFYTAADFEEALTDDLTTDFNVVPIAEFNTGFRHIIGLKTFVNERVASVQDQLDGLAPASGDGSGNCPGMWEYWSSIDFEDAIAGVSPSSKKQGDKNVKVTITLNEQVIMLPPDLSPIRVKIGNLEGEKIKRNGLKITAEFDIPSGESVGKKDVSVQFGPPDGLSLPESQIIILTKYDAFKNDRLVKSHQPLIY